MMGTLYLLTHTRLLGGMEETVPEDLSRTTIDNTVFDFLGENDYMCLVTIIRNTR